MEKERALIHQCLRHYLIVSGTGNLLLEKIIKFKENIGNARKEEQSVFRFPVAIDVMLLKQISGLADLLVKEPFFVQNMLTELVLLLLRQNLPSLGLRKFEANQVECPIILDPTQLILPCYNFGLSNVQGILLEKSLNEQHLRRSTWVCRSCDLSIVKNSCKQQQCRSCLVDMQELQHLRHYEQRVRLKLHEFANTVVAKGDRFPCLKFELGAEYLVTGVLKGGSFEAWGCLVVERVPLPLSSQSFLLNLRKIHAGNPWGFVHVLAEMVGQHVCSKVVFNTAKTGLLLSLASTTTAFPIPIIVSCEDSNTCDKLLAHFAKFAQRSAISGGSLPNLSGTFGEKWQTCGLLHLAKNGVCYLRDFDGFSAKHKSILATVMESKSVRLAGLSCDEVPLKCAVWAFVEKNRKRKSSDQVLTLWKIFGLVWRLNELKLDEYEALAEFLLDDSQKEDQLFNEEVKSYLSYVNAKSVEISAEALNMLQIYFVSIRKIRGNELPLTSLDPLQALTEAHARLNDRQIAVVEDALIAIKLCEENLGSTPLIPDPPKDLIMFKLWMKQHIQS